MNFSTVVFERSGNVAWITLNRPQVLNAYNIQMRDELFEIFSAIRDDDELSVAVVKGAGRGFCAGADLTEFGTAPSPTIARHVRFARDIWQLINDLPVPRIAAIHGFCFGSGLEIALLCDIRVAAEGTLFGFPEAHLGMIPAAAGTQTLPRACGLSASADLLLTGRRIDSEEALRLGLLYQVVSASQLDSSTRAIVDLLQRLDPLAARAALRAVREGSDLPLDAAIRLESRLAARLRRRVM